MSPKNLPRILIVDDDRGFAKDLADDLADLFATSVTHDADSALQQAWQLRPDIILLDLDLGSGRGGFDILPDLQSEHADTPIIVLTGDTETGSVVRAVKAGAFNYLCKSEDLDQQLRLMLNQALLEAHQRRRMRALHEDLADARGEFVVEDPLSKAYLSDLATAAPTDYPVLLLGETGVGKEMAARYIHAKSPRRDGPFVPVNCTAIPQHLIESEFFGYERGAFAGAESRKEGRFDLARGGTIMLDELGDAPPEIQVKLLRVLQDGTFMRVGGTQELHSDARVIAATNKDLRAEMTAGRFREDLYYRLSTVTVTIPPLRDRPEDIMPMAEMFLAKAGAQLKRRFTGFAPRVRHAFGNHVWKGNIREVEQEVVRAAMKSRGETIEYVELEDWPTTRRGRRLPYNQAKELVVRTFKEHYIKATLHEQQGNVHRAADVADIPAPSMYRILRELDISPDDFRRNEGPPA